MACAAEAYRPRAGPAAVLHAVVRDHLEEFLQTARAHGAGAGVPGFVERELRRFLTCGVLAHGFPRVRCAGCGFERLVPFACKGRGFCPSCGGRRMAERAVYRHRLLERTRRLGRVSPIARSSTPKPRPLAAQIISIRLCIGGR